MAITAQDTFTDADGTALGSHTMNVGPGWTVTAGAFEIGFGGTVPNTLTATATPATSECYTDGGASDATWQIEGALDSGAYRFYVIFRAEVDTNDNLWYVLFDYNSGSPVAELREITASVNTVRHNTSTANLGGTNVTVTITTSGTAIGVALNGSPLLSYTSSAHQAGTKVGLGVQRAGGFGLIYWDNFSVESAGLPFIARLGAIQVRY